MAEKRMFAKSIVLSDAFLDMPMSARCLYFTLSMLADDDGFVGAPKSIMRQCGASQDDLGILIAKRFILTFDSGVIVIKHWRINNYLRSDRYTETTYLEEKNTLSLDGKGAYTEGGIPVGIPGGIPSIDKVREDKSREEKNSTRNAREDAELSKVVSFYMDKINATPSGTVTQSLMDFTAELGADVVLHALGTALDEKKTAWSYISAILNRYSAEGLKTLRAVQESEQAYRERKGGKQNGTAGLDKERPRREWNLHSDLED